ncbi:polysaccharide pyruvyl transferase family protein [Pelotomaculum sp. PtaB.Bin117]|uniref:polysaccharide pyruvyl transferase family protein n=1 Tax=Pelotomaculum sp. PtaB.Bin117 TaxID=1811694 RepID=UPI0009D4B243|nr:polysaccharide pyruvyl transferase family protein [Pelotomaculum sp. PtaB.Bin117]OPX87376.1 MAG: colanic acid biosynthesis protein [Pelotomaculum sp. PtaB.Bin117]OPY62853.1 MAG: colanic acid biosynthesis protein [Pelotomaculum sp. PtaU1.Bin065]
MNILLINTNCSYNKGSEAQVVSTISAFRKVYRDAKFLLLSYVYEFDQESAKAINKENDILSVRGYPMNGNRHTFICYSYHIIICILTAILQKFICLNKLKLNQTFLKAYNEADMVIDLSGDTIADHKNFYSVAIKNCLGVLPAIILNKPYVIYSQSIGPFRWYSRWPVRFCFNRAKAIILREKISINALRSINVKNKNVFLKADCAFALDPAPHSRIKEILISEGIQLTDNEPLVGISVSRLIEIRNDQYVSQMAKYIDAIIEEMKVKVILVPHVAHYDESSQDSRDTQRRVFENLKNKSKVVVVNGNYSSRELKGIISRCDLFMGSYMHACIAALSSGVPTIVLGWAHKYKGIMSLVGLDEFVFDYQSTSLEHLIEATLKQWKDREKVRRYLSEKAEQARESALQAAEVVKQVIE